MTPASQVSLHKTLSGRDLRLFEGRDRLKLRQPTPEEPMILSMSELRDFLRCRVKWAGRHLIRLEPVERPEPLAVGTVGHVILERYYTLKPERRTVKAMTKIAHAVVRDSEIEQLSTENREMLEAMTIGYAAWSKDADKRDGVGVCMPELWFDLPLDDDGTIRVRGKIDNPFEVTNRKRTMAFMENKFKAQIRNDFLEMNLQMNGYFWALRETFPKMRTFRGAYQTLRKQLPGPRVKADLFAREWIERGADEVDQWVQDTKRAALDMIDAAIYPTPSDDCSWSCDLKNACLLRGTKDVKHILKSEFKLREDRK